MNYKQLITIAFVMNGLSMVGMKLAIEMGLSQSIPQVLIALYTVGALGALIFVITSRTRLQARSVFVGVIAGVGSMTGMAFNMMSVSLIPAYVAFPIINGGTLLIVALMGRVVFRERIGPYGIAGIMAGIAAILLLSS